MAGFILARLTFENYLEVFHIVDLQITSKNTWTDITKQLLENSSDLLSNRLAFNQQNALDHPIIIATDGAWSHRGWNANECCVAVFDLLSSCLLDLEVIIRKLPHDIYGNYEGASSQMESEGLRRILKRLKENGIQVGEVLHDGDGSTLSVVKEFFPEVEELSDIGHGGKNFYKSIVKLAKKFTGLKNLGTTCLRSFKFSITHCDSNPQLFTKLMWRQFDHYCNLNHQHCSHSIDYKPKSWKWVEDKECRESLRQEFEKVIKKSNNYCKNLTSNICESFANTRSKFTDKRLHQRIQFQLGCILAGLALCGRKEEKFNWKELLLESLELTVTSNIEKNCKSELEKTLKNMERYDYLHFVLY